VFIHTTTTSKNFPRPEAELRSITVSNR